MKYAMLIYPKPGSHEALRYGGGENLIIDGPFADTKEEVPVEYAH
jgi:hypothetical protein